MARFGAVIILIGAAAGGFAAGFASMPLAHRNEARAAEVQPIRSSGFETISHCYAVDGDTLRCGAERVRLVGIDSPEMPGHCQQGRHCVEGDPYAARAALAGSVVPEMPIRRFGKDRYGRTLALVRGPLGDLSCSQVRAGHAIYRADWDADGVMKKGCGWIGDTAAPEDPAAAPSS